MSEGFTAKEIVSRAREAGLDVRARTFRLYVDLGLVPRPAVRTNPGGGRSGYYDPRVVELLRVILQLQSRGQTLQQVKAFLDRLADVARASGRDALAVQIEAAEALSDADRADADGAPKNARAGNLGGPAARLGDATQLWKSVGGPLLAEMVRRGRRPDASAVNELRLEAVMNDGERVAFPLFLSAEAVAYRNPTRRDDAALGALTSAYASELEGRERPPLSAARVRNWLEESTDISRPNFLIAVRQPTAEAEVLGFVALGVEPERLRAGQVRLEGPYVVPEYRGQGLGRAFMERAEALAVELGARYVDAFHETAAARALACLRRFGYHPDHFFWVAGMEPERAAVEDLEGRLPKRAASRLQIKPVADPSDLEAHLGLSARVRAGTPGFYPLTPADLPSLALPNDHFFNAYLDGRLVGGAWHSKGGPRIYVSVLPEHAGSWVETAMWAHLLRYALDRGLKRVKTEAAGASEAAARSITAIGFTIESMRVCYRKHLREANRR